MKGTYMAYTIDREYDNKHLLRLVGKIQKRKLSSCV